ncbi:PAS domain S-box protein [Desulfobacterales bacterium HSG16]|nr:PAS domain S-box protein [Desulfobacterales bacterium HSG16]
MKLESKYQEAVKRIKYLENELEQSRKKEADLLVSEKKFGKLFRCNPASIIISSMTSGRYIDVNESFLKATGYSRKELIGHTSTELNVWKSEEERNRFVQILLNDGKVRNFETDFRKKSGEFGIVLMSSEVIEINGELCMLTISKDITARKKAEDALRESREKLSGILDSVAGRISMMDQNLNIVWANKVTRELFDMEIVGKKCYEIYLDKNSPCDGCIGKKTFSDGRTHEHEIVIKDKNGEEMAFWCVSSVAARHKDGQPRLVVETARNITERKKREKEERRRKNAEAANLAKNEFLANMSHEIRTPINAIIGLISMLESTSLNSEQFNLLKFLRNSGQTLLGLINDFLDLSKIEAGQLELEKINFSLSNEIEKIVESMKYKGREKGLWLNYRIEDDVPDNLLGDPFRLRQILVNITGNAIKFTDTGGIDILIKCKNQNPLLADKFREKIEIEFSIKDTGIGIHEDKLDNIFKSFTQADISTTRKYGGTGLGLTICKKLTDIMGGKIRGKSVLEQGSEFVFTAIFELKPGKFVQDKTPVSGTDVQKIYTRTLRILLVEDNRANRIVFEFYIKNLPHHLDIAENGLVGVQKFAANEYDIVFMDIEMPIMDGCEAAEKIRAWENENNKSPVKIIALTAHALKSERPTFFAAGMNDYVIKPIDVNNLFTVIARNLNASYFKEKIQGLDTDMALKSLRGNKAIFIKVIKEFVDKHANTADEIRTALKIKDMEAAKILSHTMKSVAGYLSAEKLSQAALDLETGIRQNHVKEFDRLTDSFEDAMKIVLEDIQIFLDKEEPGKKQAG